MAELPRLVHLATRLVRDADQAEDCAQETIVGAWRRRDQLRDPGALSAWLRRSLVNRIIDRARAHREELDIDAIEADWRDDHYSVAPELVLERAELRDELEDALARLPVIYRLPVVLHDVLGWTAAEIAAAMAVGLAATKQRLRRGRMMLVSALAEDDARRQASLSQPLHCWRARRHVSAYLDQELDERTRTAVEDHLRDCPTCPPLYASIVGVRASLGGLRDPDAVVEDAIAARIRDRLEADPAGAPPDDARRRWDDRHRSGELEGEGPNPILVAAVAGPPGRALELASGSGTNAVWLATQGYEVTAVDWSPVGLANGRATAEAAGVSVEWQERDLLRWSPPARSFDLVVVVYLHLGPAERRVVYARAAAALAPRGRLVVVGHDRSNATEGEGGPPDPERLFTAAELARELLAADPDLRVKRAEIIRRVPPPGRGPIDALLILIRDEDVAPA